MNVNVKKHIGINFLVFLLILAIILACIRFIIPFAVEKAANSKKDVFTKEDYISYSAKSESLSGYYTLLASQKTDIEGMSKLDKIMSGLLVEDGADTDGDGLTDKEELEVYHTDPRKKSTADDLYSDKEKVDMGVDPTKPIHDDRQGKVINNSVSEVDLTVDTVDKAYASIQNVTGVFETLYHNDTTVYPWVGKYTIYRDYIISGFTGNMSVDVGQILSENKGLSADDFILLVSYDCNFNKVRKVNIKVNRNVLNTELKNEDTHLVIVANKKKKSTINQLISNLEVIKSDPAQAIAGNLDMKLSGFDALAVGFPIFRPTIYYSSSGNEETDKGWLKSMASSSVAVFEMAPKEKNFKQVSKTELIVRKTIAKIFNHVIPHNDDHTGRILPVYFNYEDTIGFTAADTIVGKEQAEKSADSVEIDETKTNGAAIGSNQPTLIKAEQNQDFLPGNVFPFGNFKTNFANNGICAGISSYTMNLYNQGTVSPFGSFDLSKIEDTSQTDGSTVTFDISKDAENKTLLDRGLSDFRNKQWMDDFQSGNTAPTDADNQFFNMLAAYWGISNTVDASPYMTSTANRPSYATIKRMMAAIDSGKILQFDAKATSVNGRGDLYKDATSDKVYGINAKNYDLDKDAIDADLYGYHSVNLYDYKQVSAIAANGNKTITTYFRVYDSNFPTNTETNYLVCVSKSENDDSPVEYIYMPSADQYVMGSYYNMVYGNYFKVVDETGKNYVDFVRQADQTSSQYFK